MAILDLIRPCSAWIPMLWGEKCLELFTIRKIAIPELPVDIMINILSRLPAKRIFQLWQIKKKNDLYALTTTPLFIRIHLNRATPIIVVQSLTQSSDNEIKLFLFDEEAKNKVEAITLNLGFGYRACKETTVLCGSYDGFLLFKANLRSQPPFFCIWNPITNERVNVTSSVYKPIHICGIYFHPRKKEYELVCVWISSSGTECNFEVLNLRNRQRRIVGSSSYRPDYARPPVFINGTMYWMVDLFWYLVHKKGFPSYSHSILTFNTETEELSTMEIVKPDIDASLFGFTSFFGDPSLDFRLKFQLFELDGDLCLFDSSSHGEVGVWVFNCITKCWVKIYIMTLPEHGRRWNFNWYFKQIIYIKEKGEFLATDRDNRIINCNLRLGTWKFVEKKGFEGDDFTVIIHTHGLASLHAADTFIRLKR